MTGVKAVPPMPPRLERVKVPPSIASAPSLPSRALARQVGQLPGDLEHALAVHVADDRHEQPLRRVDRDADVVVVLQDEACSPSSEPLTCGNGAQGRGAGLEDQGDHGHLDALVSLAALVSLRNASRSVTSASSCWVTCGIAAQLRASRGPAMRVKRGRSTISTGP